MLWTSNLTFVLIGCYYTFFLCVFNFHSHIFSVLYLVFKLAPFSHLGYSQYISLEVSFSFFIHVVTPWSSNPPYSFHKKDCSLFHLRLSQVFNCKFSTYSNDSSRSSICPLWPGHPLSIFSSLCFSPLLELISKSKHISYDIFIHTDCHVTQTNCHNHTLCLTIVSLAKTSHI